MLRLSSDEEKKILELDTRRGVYEAVQKFAGCHFREIERRSGLSTGMVKYHLSYLVRKGIISEERDRNNIRYFPKGIDQKNRKLLGFLRQNTVRKLMLFIIDNPGCNHKQTVKAVNISPSVVSWHMKKLKGHGIIEFIRSGRKTLYNALIDENDIFSLMSAYHDSFDPHLP